MRLVGGICSGQFGWWSNWGTLHSGWVMVRSQPWIPTSKSKLNINFIMKHGRQVQDPGS